MKMCLNWKVVAGLSALALGLWALAPNLVGAALPLLLLAICPLSMLVMMWGMRGMQGGQCASGPGQVQQPAGREQAHPVQLPELKQELASLQARQEAIASRIAQLERTAGVVREAEAVARDADTRRELHP